MNRYVEIYGAGLSGCVAAYHLAQQGFEVHLYDRERRIGGNPTWHPSIQTTVLDIEKTSNYIGIDLKTNFRKIDTLTFYRYGRKDQFTLPNLYSCERGPRPASLDSYIANLALDAGAVFHPGVALSDEHLAKTNNTILATGLDKETYQRLNIDHTSIYGYRGVSKSSKAGILLSYMLPCTNYDYAYLAADQGLLFGLLFSRIALGEQNLPQFEKILAETEDIHFGRWIYSQGAIPTKPTLTWQGKVLAGSLSGMIDPFILHGISGALTSGKVAALYFLDRDLAYAEFKKLTRNFLWKKYLKKVASWAPFKSSTVPILMWIDAHLHGVGFVK